MSPDTTNVSTIVPQVTEVICATGKIEALSPDQDFYEAGVTSVMALPILLELEDRYQVSIPDDRFIVARTPRAVAEIIVELQQA